MALGKKFQAMVALFRESSSVDVGTRACSAKPRKRRNDS